MSKLLDRLKQLYALAILRPEEENDESRNNEARTAAFVLLKTARENGVKIVFQVQDDEKKIGATPPRVTRDPGSHPAWSRQPFGGPFGGGMPTDVFEELFRSMNRQATEQPFKRPRSSNPPPSRQSYTGSPGCKPPLILCSRPGTCAGCGKPYVVGDLVWWVRGAGCAHEACGFEKLRDFATG